MKKPRAPSPAKPAPNMDEDALLWEAATDTLHPLKRKKGRVHAAVDQTPAPAHSRAHSRQETPSNRARSASGRETLPSPMPAPSKKPPPLATFDSKTARKIGSGRATIERRIDLHGMRQSEAYAALRRFLFACYSDGLRMVLVITGKGAPADRADDASGADVMWSGRTERGILRRNVPLWLGEPDLRAIVVSYTEAAQRHGGAGAIYVHIRKPGRAG